MFTVFCILIPLVVGGIAMWLANVYDFKNYINQPARITVPEFIVGAFFIALLAFFVTTKIGPNLSRDSAINGYQEFYNGSVTQARIAVDECHRDGSCGHHYECDPYEVKVVDSPAYTDSDNNYHQEVSHYETRYHDCPYATKELDYVLDDNIGRTITIGNNYFEQHPQQWRSGHGIPGDVPRDPPRRWLDAKQHLIDGVSDPVTGVFSYANFILASDSSVYKTYDGSVAKYKKAGLLPKHTDNLGHDVLYDFGMRARKVQAVGGLKVANLPLWQYRLMRLNAALGSDLRGDMHIVLVPADKVSNPDDYITALKAYWTRLGKWSISKNGIIVAIGTSNNSTVAWSRAATGMPAGNGAMVTALNLRLQDKPFDPGQLLGSVNAQVRNDGGKLKVVYGYSSGGAIGTIVLSEFPFQRACMKCTTKGDKGVGYVELKDLVPITTGAKILMFFIILVLAVACWGALLAFDPFGAIMSFKNDYQNRDSSRF